jgi:hypothetical protein
MSGHFEAVPGVIEQGFGALLPLFLNGTFQNFCLFI